MKTRKLATLGILAALAIVLMYLEISLPLMPFFLKFDFSEVPVLIAAFAFGPLSAVAVEFIKNLAHLPVTQTMGVGELANFIYGCAFVIPAALIYRTRKKKSTALIGMGVGTASLTVVAALVNYFIMIPFFLMLFKSPIGAFVGPTQEAGNKLVTDLLTMVLFAFVPFNLFKGIVVSLIVFVIYKSISHLIKRTH